MSRGRLGALLAVILACGLTGYLGGKVSRPVGAGRQGEGASGTSRAKIAPLQVPVFAVTRLPEATFTDKRGFDAFVASLGLSREHAQWVALRMRSEQDMAGSLALAREQKAVGLWAAGAAEIDPKKAFALMQGLRMQERSPAEMELFATLGRRDPKLGLELLSRLDACDGAGMGATVNFFRNWAAVAPIDTVAAAVKRLPSRAQNLAMYGLFKTWGESDRVGMLEWASEQGPTMAKRAFRSLNGSSDGRNPEQLFELAIQFPKAADWLTLAVANNQLATAPAGYQVIGELPPGPIRDEQIWRFAANFSQRDPDAAWELMGTLSPEDQKQFFEGSIRGFAKIKPLEVAEKLKTGEFGMGSFPSVMEEWARTNPQEALAWSQGNLKGSTQLESVDAVFSAWSEKSPADAAAASRNLPAGLRAKILTDVAQNFGTSDPDAALAWADQLPQLERSRAAGAAIQGWAEKDPAAAAQALAGLPSAGMDDAFDVVARRFAQVDPSAAVQWTATLPDENRREHTIGKVVNAWAGQDAASASEYLAKIESGGFRDRAIGGFVSSVRELDPESAAVWASSIQSTDLQRSNLRDALQEWKQQDRPAAQAFVRGIKAESLRNEMQKLVNE